MEQLVDGLAPKGISFTLVSSSRALLRIFRHRGWDWRPLWCGIEPVSKRSVMLFPFTLPLFLPIMAAVLIGFRIAGVKTVLCLSLTDKLLATPIARILGMKVVWMEHLVPGPSLLMNPYRPLYAALAKLSIVIAVSEAVVSGLAHAGVSRSRISIISPGVIVPLDKAPLSGTPTVGVVARLSPEKNVQQVLLAFAEVLKRIPEARLEIFGDGPERDALESQAERLGLDGHAKFRGRVEDATALYRHLSVLAVTSHKESFGIAALEAMSWGVPVVAMRVEGMPELVIDGETGLLVQAENTTAFADSLVRVLTDNSLATSMGEAGRNRSANHFTLAKTISAWESLLELR